jgi:hypothetical protein
MITTEPPQFMLRQALMSSSSRLYQALKTWFWVFVGFAYHGKDIVFRFIIEYSSLRDFYRPLGNNK